MTREATGQNAVRLRAAALGCALWRNNSGSLLDKDGRMVRFGLGNDSAALNAVWKSSDLIGIVPVTIRPEHVGLTFGVFAAIEMKAPGWHLTPGDARGQAQSRFIEQVRSLGGIGGFCTSADEFERMVRG